MGSPNIAFPDAQGFASLTFANENLLEQQAFEGQPLMPDVQRIDNY